MRQSLDFEGSCECTYWKGRRKYPITIGLRSKDLTGGLQLLSLKMQNGGSQAKGNYLLNTFCPTLMAPDPQLFSCVLCWFLSRFVLRPQ